MICRELWGGWSNRRLGMNWMPLGGSRWVPFIGCTRSPMGPWSIATLNLEPRIEPTLIYGVEWSSVTMENRHSKGRLTGGPRRLTGLGCWPASPPLSPLGSSLCMLSSLMAPRSDNLNLLWLIVICSNKGVHIAEFLNKSSWKHRCTKTYGIW